MNSKIDSLTARIVAPNNRHRRHEEEDEEDEDALFAELEEEIENDSNGQMREYGLQALKQQMKELSEMKQNQHGHYSEIKDEKEVVRVSAREPKCVVHFYHDKFKRCAIMDKHLAKLAPKYFNTRFFRVFVENVPWLVEKLGIKILPCVICFVDGISKDRLIGFEELGNSDGFDTAVLELRLAVSGVIQKSSGNALNTVYANSTSSSSRTLYRVKDNDDDVFDLDE
ncbi:thioredoxin-like protein [Mycena rosella]|uniref:Thioredoxin-like protein n=1 Tax=Mycena rosella TaxID=1033263 RepID=A0AAD7G862_MYCRO|nr:thioredoxin-like protein [Mycena rosella]